MGWLLYPLINLISQEEKKNYLKKKSVIFLYKLDIETLGVLLDFKAGTLCIKNSFF